MSLPLSSIYPGRVYSRSSTLYGRLYRRVINFGPQSSFRTPDCIRPCTDDHWLRYETEDLRGYHLGEVHIRACTVRAFARWADREERKSTDLKRFLILFADDGVSP